MNQIKKAFKVSVPVLVTYIILGIGYGVLMTNAGYNFIWSLFSALFIYAGAGQYLQADLLATQATILSVVFLTIAINVRYAFYGVSFLDKFKNYKWYEKIYLYFGMTDETYSLLVAHSLQDKSDTKKFDIWLTRFNHIYWITGCVLGAFIGKLPIDLTGVDFIMTALFVVIFIDQVRGKDNPHLASVIGSICAIVSYLILKDDFIFPAIIASIIFLFIFRKKIEKGKKAYQAPSLELEGKGGTNND